MTQEQIEKAIDKAKKGIIQYLEIMDLLYKVDVSSHREFQKKYNAFYRVRQRTEDWYNIYYNFLENSKNSSVTFSETIDYIYNNLGRYEPSFSSKLVATINPLKPIWDEYVLENTGHKPPSYQNPNKINDAKLAYQSIEAWYIDFLQSDTGKLCISIFNEKIFRHKEITDLKKVDFILWQTRA